MTTDLKSATPVRDIGQASMLLLSLLAFADTIFNYFWTGNGIHGSPGALLVVASTFLLAGAVALIMFNVVGGAVRVVFEILICLDLLGTAVAAYFLEAWILLGLIILAALSWLVHIFRPHPQIVEVRP